MGQAVGAEPVEKALTNLASAAIEESTVTEENRNNIKFAWLKGLAYN